MVIDNKVELARHRQKTTQQEQERLYEKYVIKAIMQDEDVTKGYKTYINKIKGFRASAFNNVLEKVLIEESKTSRQLANDYQYIPDYIKKRNVWDDSKKEILTGDSPSHIKQQGIDSLDRSRTKSHNGVIDLFNKMNQYAEDNKTANPYPVDYYTFCKSNKNHRKDVANILTRHTTPIESISSTN